jgi:WD40 repeat protein
MDTLRLSRLIKGVWAYCLSFMGDGSLLVGKDNGTVDLFDPVKWTRVKTFGKHEGIVYAIASSEDGKLVASGGTDGIVYLFDSMLSKRLAEMKHLLGTPVTSLLFSPDGKLLISGGADGKIKLWDLEGREMKAAVAHPGGVVGLFYLPDEDLLISGGMDGSVAIWNPKTLGEIRRVYKGSSSVLHISISYAGKFLALGTSDGKARLIEVGSWNEIASVDLPRPATALALSPDGRRMAVGDGFGSVLIWDTHSIRPDRTISCGSHVSALAFSPDGTLLLSGGDDGGIRVWSCSKWEEIRRSWEHSARISSLAISPDSRYLASGSWDGTARIWKLQTLEVLYVLKHNAWVSSVSFSQDGQWGWNHKGMERRDGEDGSSLQGWDEEIRCGLLPKTEDPRRRRRWREDLRMEFHNMERRKILRSRGGCSASLYLLLHGWEALRIRIRGRLHKDMGCWKRCAFYLD